MTTCGSFMPTVSSSRAWNCWPYVIHTITLCPPALTEIMKESVEAAAQCVDVWGLGRWLRQAGRISERFRRQPPNIHTHTHTHVPHTHVSPFHHYLLLSSPSFKRLGILWQEPRPPAPLVHTHTHRGPVFSPGGLTEMKGWLVKTQIKQVRWLCSSSPHPQLWALLSS